MTEGDESRFMSDRPAADRWQDERTTFQRVYDTLVGTRSFASAGEFAERANCSETAARDALEQLIEMGIAERRDGRPATYCRNDAYLRWKRVESLAREHSRDELRERLEELVAEDDAFQKQYGVPSPDAVTTADLPVEDVQAADDRWAAVRTWHTVRRDIELVRRALDRVVGPVDEGVHA